MHETRYATYLELNKRLREVWARTYAGIVSVIETPQPDDAGPSNTENAGAYAEERAWEAVRRANGGKRPVVGVAEVASVKRGAWSGDTMLNVGGKPFRCECGANVFKRRTDDPLRIRCNGCGAMFRGE